MVPEPGGPGGPLAPQIFGRSVNPIPTGEGRLSPTITTGTPNVFHLPASLNYVLRRIFLYSLSTFDFMHYFLEKPIMLTMKTEKHPVSMQICIAI